jgi:hypothetical protein
MPTFDIFVWDKLAGLRKTAVYFHRFHNVYGIWVAHLQLGVEKDQTQFT